MELRPGPAGSPPGQLMSLPCGGRRPRGEAAAGQARGPPAAGCPGRECNKVIILADRRAAAAAVRKLGPRAAY